MFGLWLIASNEKKTHWAWSTRDWGIGKLLRALRTHKYVRISRSHPRF